MPTVTPKALADGVLVGATDTTIYAAPGGTTAVIRTITLTNIDTTAKSVDIHIVQSGGSVATSKRILDATAGGNIPAGYTLVLDAIYVLETGDFISAIASGATSIAMRVDGSEIT